MSDLSHLYDACRLTPDDDTLRTALADELEGQGTVSVPCPQKCSYHEVARSFVQYEPGGEHMGKRKTWFRCAMCKGAGSFPDASNRDRAELIRVQVELAKLPPRHRELFVADGAGTRMEGLGVGLIHEGDGHYSVSSAERGLSIEAFAPNERVDIYAELAGKRGARWVRGLRYVKHVEDRQSIIFRKDDKSGPWAGTPLAARESALLATHKDWLPPCPLNGGTPEGDTLHRTRGLQCGVCKGSSRIGQFCRGLLELEVPSLVTCFEQCGKCEGWGELTCTRLLNDGIHNEKCPQCKGMSYTLTPWAQQLRAWFPWVVAVGVADRVPFEWTEDTGSASHNGKTWFSWLDPRKQPGESSYRVPGFLCDEMVRGGACRNPKRTAVRFETRELARAALASAMARAIFSETFSKIYLTGFLPRTYG